MRVSSVCSGKLGCGEGRKRVCSRYGYGIWDIRTLHQFAVAFSLAALPKRAVVLVLECVPLADGVVSDAFHAVWQTADIFVVAGAAGHGGALFVSRELGRAGQDVSKEAGKEKEERKKEDSQKKAVFVFYIREWSCGCSIVLAFGAVLCLQITHCFFAGLVDKYSMAVKSVFRARGSLL